MTVGCAGGYIYDTFIPIEWSEESGTKMTISLSNLQGGHSGAEIQKQLEMHIRSWDVFCMHLQKITTLTS